MLDILKIYDLSLEEFMKQLRIPKSKDLAEEDIKAILREYVMTYQGYLSAKDAHEKSENKTEEQVRNFNKIYNFFLGFEGGIHLIMEKLDQKDVLNAVQKKVFEQHYDPRFKPHK